ncbi:MAG TPA: DUF123 domain-containing protein [Thermoleophilia bacterium]|nr:DUF123 domain-containing protein [Thermoleophilia bacterium]
MTAPVRDPGLAPPATSRPGRASAPPAPARLYIVLVRVPRRTTVAVGSLGAVRFERGWYVYVGSAVRGREARVARHLAAHKPLRWHADYLTTAFPPERGWLVDGAAGECELAGALAALPGAERRPRRFGAGDCCCAGHLVRLPRRPPRRDLAAAARAAGAPARVSVRPFGPR